MSTHAWMALAALCLVVPAPARTYASTPDNAVAVSTVQAMTPPARDRANPPDYPSGRISGLVYADYYGNLAGDPIHAYDASGADSGKAFIDASGKPITRDLNGLLIRRVYFQLDNDLTARLASRFRLEVDSKSLTSDGKLGVAVKAAYLQAKNVYPRGSVLVGMLSTPTWESAESFWAYRSIEKTVADFNGIGSSADLGVAVKGYADGDHHVGYTAMIGNGTGQRPENNRYKKFYLTIPVRVGELRIEPYADYEQAAAKQDRATYKLFTGYAFRRVAVGIEALDRVNHRTDIANQEFRALSLFARGTPWPTVGAFARVDLVQPDHNAADRVDRQLWIAGVDWQPVKDVHVMPNVEATQYDAKGTAIAPAHHDLQARITLYYKFSRPQS